MRGSKNTPGEAGPLASYQIRLLGYDWSVVGRTSDVESPIRPYKYLMGLQFLPGFPEITEFFGPFFFQSLDRLFLSSRTYIGIVISSSLGKTHLSKTAKHRLTHHKVLFLFSIQDKCRQTFSRGFLGCLEV